MSHKASYKGDRAEALRLVRIANRYVSDVPRICPVCVQGRQDAAAIALHNLCAAKYGCRSYKAVGL
jgi:hypothetical protein